MPMHHVVVRWIAWRWAIGPGQERLSPAGRPSPTPAHGRGAVPVVVPSAAHITEPVLRHTALGQALGTGSFPYGASAWRRGQLALGGTDRSFLRAVLVCTPNTDSREADAMLKLTF